MPGPSGAAPATGWPRDGRRHGCGTRDVAGGDGGLAIGQHSIRRIRSTAGGAESNSRRGELDAASGRAPVGGAVPACKARPYPPSSCAASRGSMRAPGGYPATGIPDVASEGTKRAAGLGNMYDISMRRCRWRPIAVSGPPWDGGACSSSRGTTCECLFACECLRACVRGSRLDLLRRRAASSHNVTERSRRPTQRRPAG
jgi:hypothetical protein